MIFPKALRFLAAATLTTSLRLVAQDMAANDAIVEKNTATCEAIVREAADWVMRQHAHEVHKDDVRVLRMAITASLGYAYSGAELHSLVTTRASQRGDAFVVALEQPQQSLKDAVVRLKKSGLDVLTFLRHVRHAKEVINRNIASRKAHEAARAAYGVDFDKWRAEEREIEAEQRQYERASLDYEQRAAKLERREVSVDISVDWYEGTAVTELYEGDQVKLSRGSGEASFSSSGNMTRDRAKGKVASIWHDLSGKAGGAFGYLSTDHDWWFTFAAARGGGWYTANQRGTLRVAFFDKERFPGHNGNHADNANNPADPCKCEFEVSCPHRAQGFHIGLWPPKKPVRVLRDKPSKPTRPTLQDTTQLRQQASEAPELIYRLRNPPIGEATRKLVDGFGSRAELEELLHLPIEPEWPEEKAASAASTEGKVHGEFASGYQDPFANMRKAAPVSTTITIQYGSAYPYGISVRHGEEVQEFKPGQQLRLEVPEVSPAVELWECPNGDGRWTRWKVEPRAAYQVVDGLNRAVRLQRVTQ